MFNWSSRIDWCAYWHSSVIIWPKAHETWGHLRSNFDWPFWVNKCMFRCVLTREIYWSSNYFYNFLRSKIIQQNHIAVWGRCWLRSSKVNSRPKAFQMCTIDFVSSRASRSFFFCEALAQLGAERLGFQQTLVPPPLRHVGRWEKPFTGDVQNAWLFNCVFMSKTSAIS